MCTLHRLFLYGVTTGRYSVASIKGASLLRGVEKIRQEKYCRKPWEKVQNRFGGGVGGILSEFRYLSSLEAKAKTSNTVKKGMRSRRLRGSSYNSG